MTIKMGLLEVLHLLLHFISKSFLMQFHDLNKLGKRLKTWTVLMNLQITA